MAVLPTGWRCMGLVLGLGIGQTPASAQPSVTAEAPPPIALTMPVHVKSDRPVVLYLQLPGNLPEKQVLATTNPSGETVTAWLPKYGRLRVGGPGVASAEVQLPFVDSAALDIQAGCHWCSPTGTALMVTGGIVTAVGLWVLIGGVIQSLSGGDAESAVGPPGWLPLSSQLYISGGVLLPVGIIAFITGAVSYSQGITRVHMSPDYSPTALRLPGGLRLAARGVEF